MVATLAFNMSFSTIESFTIVTIGLHLESSLQQQSPKVVLIPETFFKLSVLSAAGAVTAVLLYSATPTMQDGNGYIPSTIQSFGSRPFGFHPKDDVAAV